MPKVEPPLSVYLFSVSQYVSVYSRDQLPHTGKIHAVSREQLLAGRRSIQWSHEPDDP